MQISLKELRVISEQVRMKNRGRQLTIRLLICLSDEMEMEFICD